MKIDNKTRCPWVNLENPDYILYHDKEWGRPVFNDHILFEFLILEGAQAGLSWETILKKRVGYKKHYLNFDPEKVARISSKKISEILKDPGIIRHKKKVESAITNAKHFLEVCQEYGSFHQYLWGFVDHKITYHSFNQLKDYPTQTFQSMIISKDLKKRGFAYVGATTIYAYMQAVGIVQDHSKECYLHLKKFSKIY